MESRFLERALELAENGRGTAHPNPIVGAVVVSRDEIVGEGWHERKGGPHAEVVALEAAGERARGTTVYATLEPCAHHGATPPCVDALLAAGVARVVAGQLDPTPTHGGGLEKLRAAGVEVELAGGELAFRCRQQVEEWRTWVTEGRPYVTYKVALTLDGRVRMPGERWVTGEASRKLVHVLRAQSDAVAVGMGTVRWDNPRLDARDVPVVRQPRRIAFGRGPLPDGSELELRPGPLREELAALAADARPVTAPRGRPDPRCRVPRGGSRRQAPRVRRAAALRRGARHARGTSAPVGARTHGGATDRRGRSAAGVRPRAVGTVRGCSPGSFGSSASSSRQRKRAAAVR